MDLPMNMEGAWISAISVPFQKMNPMAIVRHADL